jgi:microcompartment protein CcmK/EutM
VVSRQWSVVNGQQCCKSLITNAQPLPAAHCPLPTEMIIARILGTVVSTQKDERLKGKKLLIVKPINLDGTDQSGYLVAVDTVGAGFHEKVIVVGGSSARMAEGNKDCPVDSAIIGVIDKIDFI